MIDLECQFLRCSLLLEKSRVASARTFGEPKREATTVSDNLSRDPCASLPSLADIDGVSVAVGDTRRRCVSAENPRPRGPLTGARSTRLKRVVRAARLFVPAMATSARSPVGRDVFISVIITCIPVILIVRSVQNRRG
jgi:hypothetical protein